MSRTDSNIVARREARLARALASPDTGKGQQVALAKWHLPKELSEVSGIALSADDRLFTHGDETARVFEVAYRTGRMVGSFSLGSQPVKGDFEAITSVGDSLYLLTSDGLLYQFAPGKNGDNVPYTKIDTGLKEACEFEGLTFDPARSSFLLLCKNVFTKGALKDSLVIYQVRHGAAHDSAAGDSARTRITTPLAPIIGPNDWKSLHPSDITVDPVKGNYVIVAADERALVEITPTGELVEARALGKGLAHVEGVAITKDHLLILSTEGDEKVKPAITLYRWPERR